MRSTLCMQASAKREPQILCDLCVCGQSVRSHLQHGLEAQGQGQISHAPASFLW